MHIAPGVAIGGGIASLIVHLFIWHEIWRLVRFLWHIRTFGPFIVVALGLLLVAGTIWRRSDGGPRRGGLRSGGLRWGGLRWGGRRAGSAGYDSGSGPRDW